MAGAFIPAIIAVVAIALYATGYIDGLGTLLGILALDGLYAAAFVGTGLYLGRSSP